MRCSECPLSANRSRRSALFDHYVGATERLSAPIFVSKLFHCALGVFGIDGTGVSAGMAGGGIEPFSASTRLIKAASWPHWGGGSMNSRLLRAALAATTLVCQFTAAQATCVISPDHKSISVVTDNGASDEKTCSVSCKTGLGAAIEGC